MILCACTSTYIDNVCVCVCVCVQYKDLLQLMIDATGDEGEGGDSNGENASKCSMHNGNEASQPKKTSKERKLTDEEVVGQAVTFLMAGYETTANTLAYTSYLLALNPDIQERLQSEIDSYFNDNNVCLCLQRYIYYTLVLTSLKGVALVFWNHTHFVK